MRKRRYFYLTLFFGFLLGVHNGFIALWQDGCAQPVEVYPYRADSLPPVDQRALEKGIAIGSSEELANLLEDYLS